MNEVQEQVKNDQIDDRVIFLGVRNDVPKLLNAMDIFVLPSRYEGLPVALVEVQANGLPTYVSTAVTTEMKVSSNMHFISIDNDYCHCGITYRGPGFDVNYAASFVLQVKRDPMSVPVHRIVV